MADKRINDLPALVSQVTTDVYEISNNAATLSSKETRAQMLSYTAANIAGAPYTEGDMFYADTPSTLAKLSDVATGNVLISGGIGLPPGYGKVTYGHMQTEAANSLLGNPTDSTGAVSEITLGAGLEFSGTTLVSTATSDVTLQNAYDNGTPTAQGSINLTPDNLNPIAIFNSYISGDLATYQEHFTAINTTTANVFWGYGFKAPNSSSNYKDFAHIYANVEDNTAGDETGSLGLYTASFGALTRAFFIDGAAQEISSMWPMTVENGTRTYQTTKLLTGDVAYSIDYTGSVILSDNLGDHTVAISNYYSTNGDDSFVVQTQSTNVATLILSGGVTINGSASDFVVPVNTRATVQLVNAGTKAYMVTMVGVPAPAVAFAAYATTAQNGVTGSGTLYTVQFDLQTGDVSPDFDGTTFTAPSTGFYPFSAFVSGSGFNSNNTNGILFLQTTSQSFVLWEGNPYAMMNSGAALTMGGSATVFLNAGDTAIIQLLVDLNSTDNVNVSGDPATAFTYFSGSLVNTGSGSGGSGEVDVIDDNSTNATMFPLWVTSTSGAQPTYVSSAFMRWNPNQSSLSIGPTGGDNISLFSGEMIRWSAGPFDTIWDMGQLSGTIFGNGMGPPNWSLYDYNNSSWVLIADTLGQIGVNPTTFYFMYPYNTFPNSTTASQLMATDSNNLVTSVPNTLGEVNITDDNSTDATRYPVWVAANSGNQPTYVSSNGFTWNPDTGNLIVTNPGPFGPTFHLNSTAAPGSASSWTYHESSGTLKAAFGYRDSVTSAVIYVNGGDRLIVDSSGVVNIPQLTPSSYVATDGSSNLISVAAPVVPISGQFTQGVVNVSNTSTLSSTKAFYSAPSQNSGDVVTITCEGQLTSTNTSIVFLLSNPIGGTYSGTGLAGGVCTLWATGNPEVSYDIDSYNGYAAVVVKAIVASGLTYNFSCSYQVVLP